MKRLGVIAATLIAMLSSPARADNWWLVFQAGEKPDRVAVLVDEGSISPYRLTGKYQIDTMAVLENEKAPDWITTRVLVDCGGRTLEETLVMVSPRDDFVIKKPDKPPYPIKDDVDQVLFDFVCGMAAKTETERAAARELDQIEQGLLYMGPGTDFINATDIIWAGLWKDSKRPVVPSKRSQEEIAARQAEDLAKIEQIKTLAYAMAGKVIEDDAALTAQLQGRAGATRDEEARAKARKKREWSLVRNTLEPWIGQSEQELVRVWGPPTSSEGKGGQRIVNYYKGFVETVTKQGSFGPAPVSENTFGCIASFELQGGVVVDYATEGRQDYRGNSCERVFGTK